MTGKYILDENRNAILEPDLFRWADWLETHDRRVRSEMIGQYLVSTVFLGLDHNFALMPGEESERPILFETMVFHAAGVRGGSVGDIQERCSTWDEALAQHDRVAEQMRKTAAG